MKRWLKQAGPHVILGMFVLYILLPPLWVLRTSFVPEALAYHPDLLPSFTLENYGRLFAERGFGRAMIDSLVVALAAVLVALPFAAMTGYAFARYRTGGRLGRFLVLATQMLPAIVLVMPAFAMFRPLGLTNSLLGLIIVYAALNLPFLTWILMGFFEGVPIELEYAALVDGARPWGAFWRIVVPVALPGLAAAGILGFILAWNEFIFALILTGPGTPMVPVVQAAMQSQNGTRITEVSAATVLAIIPLAVIAKYVQRYIVAGLTFGAVK